MAGLLRNVVLWVSLVVAPAASAAAPAVEVCSKEHTVHTDVVALDQPIMVNRLGTIRPGGMMYALRRDVVSRDGGPVRPGNVLLRDDKRPRPIVLRVNEGDCLEIAFQNLLDPQRVDELQPKTRIASIHVTGLEAVKTIADNGNFVGEDGPRALAAPGQTVTYLLHAPAEGSFLLYSSTANYNGVGTQQLTMGLFGSVSVEPRGAEWYRSQVTSEDLALATTGRTPDGHPILDYGALYPADYDKTHPSPTPRACTPVLRMMGRQYQATASGCQPVAGSSWSLYHTDLTALITGPGAGRLTGQISTPLTPDRDQPFREFTIHYHESQDVIQPFPEFYQGDVSSRLNLSYTLATGRDGFAINYGIAGIGAEILANRLDTGALKDCQECKYEEFFLSSWAAGDPAMLVDRPANLPKQLEPRDPRVTPPPTDWATDEKYGNWYALERLADASAGQSTPFNQLGRRATGNVQTFDYPPTPGEKATRAFYPDDPSNVYHSYLGDHVRFRILHAGAAVHHVHHHHAHQWLHSDKSEGGHYLDSQAFGPGASYTLDLVYNGSGNLNLTPGDSIFHCHFYPHFAAGMWALQRVHDVFEAGTPLDAEGRPAPGARALPDAEIKAGTPIPAVVPLPTLAMAPVPGAKVSIAAGQVKIDGAGNPGFPFFVPGLAGHRAPHPPLDFAVETQTNARGETKELVLNGGLPRHVVRSAKVAFHKETPFDFSKELDRIDALELPEKGTEVERAAMGAFSKRHNRSFTPEGKPGDFHYNGGGPKPGAPFADPGVDENGDPVKGETRHYRGANLQVNAVFNKKGWHFPQQRMIALWDDVVPTLRNERPPQPFFLRANLGEVVEYWHANLVPAYYEADDFQVRTPTDLLGQHIHLVKFDVLASDGAANGFNYEDGTFSPDEVRGRIAGINKSGGLLSYGSRQRQKLSAKTIPALGEGPNGSWLGAQATVQRWYVDPGMNEGAPANTQITVFTHDHYGPSTHQQAGLYGGLLVEPKGSRWFSLDGRLRFGSRGDGGPTSYAANILTARQEDSFREFALEWQDLQLAYLPSSRTRPDCYPGDPDEQKKRERGECFAVPAGQTYRGWADPASAINPPCASGSPTCPDPFNPQPQVISDFGAGMFSMNYRSEPIPLRVNEPTTGGAASLPPEKARLAQDLAHAFRSIERVDPAFNSQPRGLSPIDPGCDPKRSSCFVFPQEPISGEMGALDPYTPLLRAYQNDKVQVRLLAGAHTSMHDFTLHGVRWLFEPNNPDSGYRNSQLVLLSEHFEVNFQLPTLGREADYLYVPSTSYEGLVNGSWGLLRAYKDPRKDLQPLPNNPVGAGGTVGGGVAALDLTPSEAVKNQPCDQGKPCLRRFTLTAVSVAQASSDKGLVYNSRGIMVGKRNPETGVTEYAPDPSTPLVDPYAIMYVLTDDLDAQGKLRPGKAVEPLVLRVNAGDWIQVRLENRFTGKEPVFQVKESAAKPGIFYSNPYQLQTLSASPELGLHPQLVSYDITRANGINAGNNPVQTAAPGKSVEYTWYAGKLEPGKDGKPQATPVEFGAINLLPADSLMHAYRGLFGALVVEPAGATWKPDPGLSTSATVFPKEGPAFREFVLLSQDDTGMQLNKHPLYDSANALSAFNYRTEPMFYRLGDRMGAGEWSPYKPPRSWEDLTEQDMVNIGTFDFTSIDTWQSTANCLVGGDPQTPVFRAPAGMPFRFRLLAPNGNGDNQQVFELGGHVWQEEPYVAGSARIGDNPKSTWTGVTSGYGPTSHFEVVVARAGGAAGVPGDYLYRSWPANQYQAGLWGLFRVAPAAAGKGGFPDTVAIDDVATEAQRVTVSGTVTVDPASGGFHKDNAVRLTLRFKHPNDSPCEEVIDAAQTDRGTWKGQGPVPACAQESRPASVAVQSVKGGGVATWIGPETYRAMCGPEPKRSLGAPAPLPHQKVTRRRRADSL